MALRSHSLAFTGLWLSANGQKLLIFIRLLKGITCILIFLCSLFLHHCNMREFQADFWIERNVIFNRETVFLCKAFFVCWICLHIPAWQCVRLRTQYYLSCWDMFSPCSGEKNLRLNPVSVLCAKLNSWEREISLMISFTLIRHC